MYSKAEKFQNMLIDPVFFAMYFVSLKLNFNLEDKGFCGDLNLA